jgi:hypothetical protein
MKNVSQDVTKFQPTLPDSVLVPAFSPAWFQIDFVGYARNAPHLKISGEKKNMINRLT